MSDMERIGSKADMLATPPREIEGLLGGRVTKAGTILIHDGRVQVDGFETSRGGCREVAAQACLYGARFLLSEALALMDIPGGTDRTSLDIHPDQLDELKAALESNHG